MLTEAISTVQTVGSLAVNTAAQLPAIGQMTLENLRELFDTFSGNLQIAIDDWLDLIDFDLCVELKKLAGCASDSWSPAEWQQYIEDILNNAAHPLHQRLSCSAALGEAIWDRSAGELLEELAEDLAFINWHQADLIRADFLRYLEESVSDLNAVEREFYDAFVERFFL